MALGRELPDDLAADVLRRLPPRSLAVSRCVCKTWRDVVDARRLLRADLLPRAVAGIFIHYNYFSSEFLARPTAAGPSIISGDLEDFVPDLEFISQVMGHCNGLLLCTNYDNNYVVNPATRQWPRLPPPPKRMRNLCFREAQCLVYDPAVSPHYHVFFLIGSSSSSLHQQQRNKSAPDALRGCVYSSETGRWEERWFAPEVPEAAIVAVALEHDMPHNKVYWRGRLYLLCQSCLVLRISISNANYRLFPLLAAVKSRYRSLGRSEKGIYCAVEYRYNHLQIFLFNESCAAQVVWELKHTVDLATFARKLHARENNRHRPNGPWILEDINYYKYPDGNDKRRKQVVEDNFEWNSDDDNVLSTEDMVEGRYKGYTSLLGFHPYKEVVFLDLDLSRAVAYHWNTSKFQDFGNICPKDYREFADGQANIETSFIYTPCWMDNFPKK